MQRRVCLCLHAYFSHMKYHKDICGIFLILFCHICRSALIFCAWGEKGAWASGPGGEVA